MYLSQMCTRTQEFFGFDWGFYLEEGGALTEAQAQSHTQWRPVQLPHDWSIDYPVDEKNPSCGSGGYAQTGISWYRKDFEAAELGGRRAAILFEGVYMNCTVWLNGEKIGAHVYGYTSFELDVTDSICPGKNTLLVRVDNSMQPNSRWYTGSGITRNVWLCATAKQHIPLWGVYVTTPKASGDYARVDVVTDVVSGGGLRLESAVLDGGAVVAKCVSDVTGKTCAQSLTVTQPKLWSNENPAMYTLVSKLYDGNALIDETHTPFGIREIRFDADGGFFINGKHVKLRGVCVHHDGGCVGAAVPPEIWRTRFEKFRAMGVNAIRCSHNPPDPAFLDLCDEMGFFVMDEAFDEWRELKGKEFGSNTHESRGYSEWFDECYLADMHSMLLRDRNHPSIVIWSIGNEVPEQKTEKGTQLAKELAKICHDVDPTRPVTQANDQIRAEPTPAREDFLDALDIVGYNYVDRWRERTELMYAVDKQKNPHRLIVGSEHSSVGGRRAEYSLVSGDGWRRRAYSGRSLKAEKLLKFTEAHDYVAGDFMWTGIDHLGECFWPDKGSSAGVMDTCGFEKDGYYFYQSQWTKEPMLHLLPHWNMPVEPGTVIPVLCYTNCEKVELFVNGKSYGTKCYEFPAQGMSLRWAHFDRPVAPITTNDLHLSWDVPFGPGEVEAVGYKDGEEVIRAKIQSAGKPHHLEVVCDSEAIAADGRSVAQIYVRVLDENNVCVAHQEVPVTFAVNGAGALLGVDNGRPDAHELFGDPSRETYGGLAYAVIRAAREPGECKVTVSAPGLPDATVQFAVKA